MSKEQYRNKLKLIFRAYRGMTSKIESSLEEIGILVKRCRNHIVLEVQSVNGVKRSIPISRTPSDWRAGMKITSQIMNVIYC